MNCFCSVGQEVFVDISEMVCMSSNGGYSLFYFTALSSAGVVCPHQDMPYGDIQVRFFKDTLSS